MTDQKLLREVIAEREFTGNWFKTPPQMISTQYFMDDVILVLQNHRLGLPPKKPSSGVDSTVRQVQSR